MDDEPVFDLLDDINRMVHAAHQSNDHNDPPNSTSNAHFSGDWEYHHHSSTHTIRM